MDTKISVNALSSLIPKAVAWAEEQSALILKTGEPLNSTESKMAERVGVMHPELVRVLEVPSLPLPNDVELKEAAIYLGLLGPTMIGLTLGHGIYICSGKKTDRLLSHELRHVAQYEQAGSIANFLPTYLEQIVSFGYPKAPLEIDARNYEQS